MTAEQNFDWLDKQVEGLLNDFEGGESTLQETKNGFYEIIFDKLIKQIQDQQDYKQEIDEACKKAKSEGLSEGLSMFLKELNPYQMIGELNATRAQRDADLMMKVQIAITELSPKEK